MLTPLQLAFVAVLAPFLLAPFCLLLGRRHGALWPALPVLAAAVLSTLCLFQLIPEAMGSRPVIGEMTAPWIPQLNLGLSFNVDGFGVFFALLVTILGTLIGFYGTGYMAHEKDCGRFFCYFSLFMGSMVGMALADDLLLLAVFWELTSITSFLLIGFYHDREESRSGARRALLVTFLGGLCLLAAAGLARVEGITSLSALLENPSIMLDSWIATPVLLLLLGAAFTKSAQFPFHLWLPGAMAAPTPVSAYLHSATMVKAGIYLVGRIIPIFDAHPLWFPIVAGTGMLTMLVASILALVATDLKAILAYSTVAQLGLLMGVYGYAGAPGSGGLRWDLFHIASHACYKAALFMLAGIIDHETGTRDVRQLGGLFRRMPITGVALLLAAACLASLPPFTGFISKELFVKELLGHAQGKFGGGIAWVPVIALFLSAAFTVLFALRISVGVLFGKETATPKPPHDPPMTMWFPPMLLASLVLLCGVLPSLAEKALSRFELRGVMQAAHAGHLHLFHNDPASMSALIFSLCAIGAGIVCYLARAQLMAFLTKLFGGAVITRVVDGAFDRIPQWGAAVTHLYHRGGTRAAMLLPLLFLAGTIGIAAYSMFGVEPFLRILQLPTQPVFTIYALFICIGAVLTAIVKTRLTLIAMLSMVGFGMTSFWVFFRAPDLTHTQILIETISLVLFLVAMRYIPRFREHDEPKPTVPNRLLRGVIAAGSGVLFLYLVLAFAGARGAWPMISDQHLLRTNSEGGGANAVNLIIVDFRGSDTFGEVAVLTIAALGVLAMLGVHRSRPAKESGTAT